MVKHAQSQFQMTFFARQTLHLLEFSPPKTKTKLRPFVDHLKQRVMEEWRDRDHEIIG